MEERLCQSGYVFLSELISTCNLPLSLFAFYAGFVRRIVGVPKAESDAILNFLFRQISENHDFQVRFKWEVNSIAFWDNRVRPTN